MRRAKVDTKRYLWKPKWMRWPTYFQLRECADEATSVIGDWDEKLAAVLARINGAGR